MKYAPFVILLLLVGCAWAAVNVPLNESNDGQTIALQVGQTAQLTLQMSSGTGYTWELKTSDEKVIEIGERRTELENATMPGAPVRLIWPLKAAGAGQADLTAQLVRPWQRDKPAKTLTIHCEVK